MEVATAQVAHKPYTDSPGAAGNMTGFLAFNICSGSRSVPRGAVEELTMNGGKGRRVIGSIGAPNLHITYQVMYFRGRKPRLKDWSDVSIAKINIVCNCPTLE